MSEIMTPIPFEKLINWMTIKKKHENFKKTKPYF